MRLRARWKTISMENDLATISIVDEELARVTRVGSSYRTIRDSASGKHTDDSKRACSGSYRLRHVAGHALVPALSRSAPRNIIARVQRTPAAGVVFRR